MKKIAVLTIAIIIILSMTACGGGSSRSKCTICGKAATHTFQGSGYCNTHYSDAIAWAMTHSK